MRVNPVLAREITERVRTPRAAIVAMVYLLALTGVLKLTSDAATRAATFQTGCIGPGCPPPNLLLTGSLGRPIVHTILFFTLLFVCLIVPAVTAGAIASEREKQTLHTLQVTLLRPWQIVTGKLGASLAFITLLVVATLPLLSTAFWVGGVSIGEVLKGVAMVLATAVVLACLGIAASAFLRGSRAATVTAYGLMFLLTVGTFAAYGIAALNASGDPSREPSIGWVVANPFVATADVVSGQRGAPNAVPSPFSPMQSLIENDRVQRLGVTPGAPRQGFGDPPIWILSLAMFAVICAGSLFLASKRLHAPTARP